MLAPHGSFSAAITTISEITTPQHRQSKSPSRRENEDVDKIISVSTNSPKVSGIMGSSRSDEISGEDKVFYTTGRLTSEMVIKVAQMNISTLLSRSGITEMGLNVAKDTQVTLLGRAKGKHFLIYNGKNNIVFDAMPDPRPDGASDVWKRR